MFYFRFWTLKTIHTYTGVAVGAWIAEQALLGFLSLGLKSFTVAFWAHVGGFAAGLAAGGIAVLVMPRRKRLVLARAKRHSLKMRPNEEAGDTLHLDY